MMDIQNLSASKSFILCLMLHEVDFGTLFRGGSKSALFAFKIQENHSILTTIYELNGLDQHARRKIYYA